MLDKARQSMQSGATGLISAATCGNARIMSLCIRGRTSQDP